MQPNSARRASALALATVIIATSGCSLIGGGDEGPAWSPDAVEIGSSEEFTYDVAPFAISVAPSGDRFATFDDGQLCIRPLGGDVDESCVDADGLIGEELISWAPDGSRLIWTEDLRRFFRDPDLHVLDIATGDLETITDDGVDDPTDDDALIDAAPFFGPDGAVHFFRAEGLDDRYELVRIDEDGNIEEAGSIRLPRDTFPISAPRAAGEQRWVMSLFDNDDPGQSLLAIIDLDADEIDVVELGRATVLVDASGTHAVVASIDARNRREDDVYSLVSLEDGRDRSVRVDVDENAREGASAAGFSPDGSFLALTITRDDGDGRLVGLPIENDRARDEVLITDASDVIDIGDGDLTGASNFFAGGEIIWNETGTLVLGNARGSIFTIETTPGS